MRPNRSKLLRCEMHLNEMLRLVPGILAAGLVSPDGFELVSAGELWFSLSKVAALTSTLAAVGHAVSRETGIGSLSSLMLENAKGKLILLDVEAGDLSCTLFVLSDQQLLLGLLLHQARRCVGKLQNSLLKDEEPIMG